ncbi:MAG: gliding motility-associated C-terminal domain-containing protein [Chitinophagaceae bacterium]
MKYLVLSILFFTVSKSIFAQCQTGQTPTTAEYICGTKIKSFGVVASCPGANIPVPGCSDPFGTYQDINAYYYRFTCYISGPLEFTIKPLNNNDDYDWQLFDITGRNPNDIYDQNLANNIFVACNWSGNTGNTGTTTSATLANGCQGSGVPTITKAPNLIQGHTYLLMVSHFTTTGQSGYNLQFNGNSSNLVTNPNGLPRFDTARVSCSNSDVIALKINKPISCKSINKTDFDIATNPVINAAIGFGCNNVNGFTDSITITLANPLPTGSYTINIKSGTDNNTLIDECDNAMVAGANQRTFFVYKPPSPIFSTQVINETCKSDTIKYLHNGNNATSFWQWTFDGLPLNSNAQSPQVVYSNFTSRKVKLVVSNGFCSDSLTQNIAIADRLLTPNFTVSKDTTCPNNPVLFTDSTKGNIISWKWDFANAQTSSLQNPVAQTYQVLPNNKIYSTKLVVTNQLGCTDSITKNVFVRGTIPTVFDSIIPPSCASNQVQLYFKQAMICSSVSTDGSEFSITGVAPNTIVSASITNCISGAGTIVTLTLAQPLSTGNYTISLKTGSDGNTIINDCGIETIAASVSFKAFGHINTAFTTNVKLGCLADTVQFNHISNNGVNQWQWIFDGNPSTSNLQNPIIIYTDFTKRDVQLIVSNDMCSDTLKQTLPITDHSIFAKFGVVDTTCGNAGTIFIDSSKGNITNWYWNFGNGLQSNLKNPLPVNYPLSLNYAVFPVQLIVKNIAGCFDTTAFKNIIVKPSAPASMDKIENLPCSPDSFIVHFNSQMLCNSVALDGSDFSITGANSPIIVAANIINCNNSFGKDVVIKLNAPLAIGGYYKLNLKKGNDGNTILNDCGIETPISQIGFVAFTKVDASFTFIDKISCIEDTLFLNHPIANDEFKWTWIINGTPVGNVNNYILPYKQSDVKNITLITSNPVCSDTTTQTINLFFDKVNAKFIASHNIVCPTETVDFADTSTGNITNWDWRFGNGQNSNIKNPPAQSYPIKNYPTNTGSNFEDVTVRLIVSNATPCFDTAYQTIKVTSNCLIQVPSAFTPNGDGLNDFLYPLNAYKASEMTFRVFNRLGRIVFETNTIGSKWEGKFRSEKQPPGTYIWLLDYTDKETGKKISLNGTTVLIR